MWLPRRSKRPVAGKRADLPRDCTWGIASSAPSQARVAGAERAKTSVMLRPLFFLFLLCAVGSLTPATARANGRYPHSQKVLEVPNQSNRIYVRTTFGLLES